MAELRKEANAALTLMIRTAVANGATPAHLSVWNYAGFIVETMDVPNGDPMPSRIYGLPIKVDPTLRDGKVELRDAEYRTLGVIENIGGGHG